MARVTQTHLSNPETPPPEDPDRTEVLGTQAPVCRDGHVLAGRYRIEKFLDRGGMGEVYAAHDLLLQERVAVKIMREPFLPQSPVIDRFRREAQLARRVTHPHVCRIFDMGIDGELAFLSMELLSGETLARRISRGPIGLDEALPLVEQMAEALHAVHAAGVIHRDFKCANVFLVPAGAGVRAVVTDFGVARPDAGQHVTHAGVVLGTPAFMAPEQVEGRLLTPAIDVYALGIVMFNMVTGEYPFDGDSAVSVASRRVVEPAPSPRNHVPDLDPVWEEVILRCLERDPKARFADVADIPKALRIAETMATGKSPTIELVLPPEPIPRPRRLRLWISALVVLAVSVGIALGVGMSGASTRPPRAAAHAPPTVEALPPALSGAPPVPEPAPPPRAEPPPVPAPVPAPQQEHAPVRAPAPSREAASKPRKKPKRPGKPKVTAPRTEAPPDDDAPLPVP